MLELMVTNEENDDVIAIQKFLEWQKIGVNVLFNPDEVRHLNQGTDTPLLMKDNMVVGRGFFDIIDFVKHEGYGLKWPT